MNEYDNDEEVETAWDEGIKGRQRLFILHYCTDDECFMNATESYRKAYTRKDKLTGKTFEPDRATCEVNGSRLLKKEEVKIACKRLFELTQSDLDVENTYKLLKELVQLAFYNPAEILDKAGRLKAKSLEDLGEKAKCIAQITPTMYGVKYTLYDRTKAIDKLVNYLNIVRPEQKIDVTIPIMEVTGKAASIEEWNAKSEGE